MYADRVLETTTSTGTGTLTLAGAKTGYRTFLAAFGNGGACYYCVTAASGEWEVGAGSIATGGILTRTTVHSSSTGSLINFPAGEKTVFCVIPSVAMAGVLRNGSGAQFKSGGTSTTTNFQIANGTDLASLFNFGFKTAEANRNAGTSGSGGGTYKSYTVEQGSGADKVRLAETTVSYAIGYCSYCGYCTYCSYCSYCNCNCACACSTDS